MADAPAARPEGNEEGTERGTVDAKFDYMASIRMCAPRAVQVR
jgi:hypothetical protein